MDEQGDSIVETVTGTPKFYRFTKKTLQFLVLVSLFSSLYSYLSGFPFFFSYKLQFSTLIFPLFAHALDRKYMFLVCNGILAFLAKNLKFTSSTGFTISAEENAPAVEFAASPQNVAAARGEHTEQEYGDIHKSGDWEYEQEEEEEEEDDELKENGDLVGASEVNDVSVSTEELNIKFEEFIRKMKEEIRIQAKEQLVTV